MHSSRSSVPHLVGTAASAKLFYSQEHRPFAVLPSLGNSHVVPLRSTDFRHHIATDFTVRHPQASISPQAYHSFLHHMEARVPEHECLPVYRRIGTAQAAINPDSIVIDLNDGSFYNRVYIGPEGWQAQACDLYFESSLDAAPMPEPKPCADPAAAIDAFLDTLNLATPEDRIRALACGVNPKTETPS